MDKQNKFFNNPKINESIKMTYYDLKNNLKKVKISDEYNLLIKINEMSYIINDLNQLNDLEFSYQLNNLEISYNRYMDFGDESEPDDDEFCNLDSIIEIKWINLF